MEASFKGDTCLYRHENKWLYITLEPVTEAAKLYLAC